MSLRDLFLENFAGDLEYHPRRAALYFGLSIAAGCVWYFSPATTKFTVVPLVFALGSLSLLLKRFFLLRKTSEGIGLSQQELDELTSTSHHKKLPSLPALAAQVVQDFGAGSLLLGPLLSFGETIDHNWVNPPKLSVFLCGAILFALGWLVRRYTMRKSPNS